MVENEDHPAVRLQLEGTAEAPAIVRGALSAVAEQLRLDAGLLDDLKTAVTEACNNVLVHAYAGSPGPLAVCLYFHESSVGAVVRDHGRGMSAEGVGDEHERGVGLPIIKSLARQTRILQCADGGTEVKMEFARDSDGRRLLAHPPPPAPEDAWIDQLDGETVVSLSPVRLVSGALGRVSRALAARACFSIDRFSDLYLVTDAIATHAVQAASGSRIGFGLSAATRRLETTIGPLRSGASGALARRAPVRDAGSALALLADELEIVTSRGNEMLRIVMNDQRGTREHAI